MARGLIVQLARLGDLMQTLPAITALRVANPALTLDVLCPSHLSPVGRMLPGITNVLGWDGAAWRARAKSAETWLRSDHVRDAEDQMRALTTDPYDCAFVLNQHRRALLAGALLAHEMRSPRRDGPLGEQLTPWAAYVSDVAMRRRGCRVHLADAFCGLCGVAPPSRPSTIVPPSEPLPSDLEGIGAEGSQWIGVIVGAGDQERLVPLRVWRNWIVRFFETGFRTRVVLVGQERERGKQIQDMLPSAVSGRLWDATGRTSLSELADILSRCHWVIGPDTGPLHLAAALGVNVIGLYFARARVHETGPYGLHHLVWQAAPEDEHERRSHVMQPEQWPIEDTIAAVMNEPVRGMPGWSVWSSQHDQWGAYYTEVGHSAEPPPEREQLWRQLQPV